MKAYKIITIILSVFIVVLLTLIIFKNPYDVNRDGKVNSKDLLDLRNYLIEKGDDK